MREQLREECATVICRDGIVEGSSVAMAGVCSMKEVGRGVGGRFLTEEWRHAHQPL